MTRSLATGPIRFGVTPRRDLDAIDSDAGLSTGPAGDFLRRRRDAFFFADSRSAVAAVLPTTRSVTSMPFWTSLKPDGTPRRWGFLGLMALGVIFILLGFAVIIAKGGQGWVEVVLGIAMIATPIVLTAQERKLLREKEERERVEREAREKRNREMLASYTAALERAHETPDAAALEVLRRERETLELPYDIWSPLARRTVLQIGFEALGRLGPAGAGEVATSMTDAANAAGLTPEDEVATKTDVYRTVVWHLLADDRHGDAQEAQLDQLRRGFNVWERDVPPESKAVEEFHRLRGISTRSLPRTECTIRLGFHEYCVHHAQGHVVEEKRKQRVAGEPLDLYVTNKRLIVTTKKPVEIPLPKIDDVEVDVDTNTMTIEYAGAKHPIRIEVADPIYTASLIDIATSLNERPRGFA